jgi:putative nucleotidyltransferase with HDIG domain
MNVLADGAHERKRILLFVFEQPEQSQPLARLLANVATVRAIHVSELETYEPVHPVAVVCDFNLNSGKSFRAVQAELARPAYQHVPRLIVMDRGKSLGIVEAGALGATETIPRPFDPETTLTRFRTLFASGFARDMSRLRTPLGQGVSSAHSAIQRIFEGGAAGSALTLDDIVAQEEPTIEAIQAASLRGWLEAIRHHHSQTYRHCLAVTGIAVAFAQHLGMNLDDQRRIARAAVVHDVGKAQIPLAILDKPGRLTAEEAELIREHPGLGVEALLSSPDDFSPEAHDVVLHHHEMLDGSGYPDRLVGAEISDIVRIITIADVFSALIEDRPYKQSASRADAWQSMQGLSGRLDADLLRAFQGVALYN